MADGRSDDGRRAHQQSVTIEELQRQLRQETQVKIAKIEQDVAAHKEEIIARLLAIVCDIKPQLHRNVRPAAA